MNEASSSPPALSHLLSQHRVFGLLAPATRQRLAGLLRTRTVPEDTPACTPEDLQDQLHWLISGRVSLLDDQGNNVLLLQPGELFGMGAMGTDELHQVWAVEDSCVVSMERNVVERLRSEQLAMAVLLPEPSTQPVQAGHRHSNMPAEPADASLNLMTTAVRSLIKREPVTLPPQTSIRAAAQLMSEQRVSSVLIVEQDHLFGVVTDRDLRNRVIAAGLDTERPIMDIATLAPLSIDVQAPAFDALLLMARHNIHHVPVLDEQHTVGMITATDLTEQHSTSAVYLAGDIYKQGSVEGLQRASTKIRRLQQSLAAADASAYSTGHIITAITDAITTRLLQLGEARLGPAPVDYVWVAAGSQARNEQTAKSDQDNCMVLDNRYDEAQHGAYFKALAQFVCDGLDACGYVYCPGDMMAMTDTWRQPQQRWAEYFARWTSQPDPTALMLTCVFFDLRAIYGNTELLDQLRRNVLKQTQGNSLFLAHMVGNALSRQPPLGLFKGISTIRSGEHKGCIDLKHNGVVPIVDLARVYALAGGDAAINSHDRLLSAAAGGAISEQGAHDLRDALEFLAYTRIQHQARQISQGHAPDNFLNPTDLSNFERSQLKDAFVVVQSLQNVIGQRYRH